MFGRNRDDWGNWFGNNNPTWVWHYWLPVHYVQRNPQLAVKSTRQTLATYPDATRCFPVSRTQQRFNDPSHANHVTSGNSPMPYRDDLFGPEFAASIFISEPVHNLIHHEALQPDGVTFSSHRAPDEKRSEFLASTDPWFRPAMLKTGPDGALYIADMYRLVNEHPQWIPPDIQKRLDLRAGSDMGRIYRVYPEGAKPRPIPRLDQLDTAGLVAAMESPNGWQRDTAQRLLLHRRDPAAVGPLVKLAANNPNPKVRLQALCAGDSLRPSPENLMTALRDPHPSLREHAVRLSEPFLRNSSVPPNRHPDPPPASAILIPLEEALLSLVEDSSIRVRYQLAFTLGEWSHPQAARALLRLAERDFDNLHCRTAILTSAPRHGAEMLRLIFAAETSAAHNASLLEHLLAQASVQGDQQILADVLAKIITPPDGLHQSWQFSAMTGLLDAIGRRNTALDQLHPRGHAASETAEKLTRLFSAARDLALDQRAPESERVVAARLLGRDRAEQQQDIARLAELLLPQSPITLQQTALSALRRSAGDRVADVTLANWRTYGPAMRLEILNLLFSRPEWLKTLLTAIEASSISPGEIGATYQQNLILHPNASIRLRAASLFSASRSDRAALLKEYANVGKLSGDPARGLELYRQNCAACHKLGGEGIEMGPDLGGVADKSNEALLVAILDPNQAVEARYINYTALTITGLELSGIITAETPNSITLRATGGAEETLLRGDIQELSSSGLSIMPEGFEKGLTPQDIADLIASFASGNKP